MCLGPTHALSGLVTGTAVGLYVTDPPLTHLGHFSPKELVIFAGLTGGAAVLPDIDHPDSSLAHCFGFLTRAVATVVGAVSGGHRHLTHAVLGVAAFTGLAWLAVRYRGDLAGEIGLALFLALILAGGLYAMAVRGHGADALAVAGAIALTVTGTGLGLVALAVGLGCATHVVGDMLTDQGCPLLFPFSRYHFRLLPGPLAFTTGTRPELWLLDPALLGGLGYLAYQSVALGVFKLPAGLPR